MSLPQYVGEAIPMGNVGKMRNNGVEMDFNYRQNFGELLAPCKRQCLLPPQQTHRLRQRTGLGQPGLFPGHWHNHPRRKRTAFPFFYGYRTNGIIQNQAEADAYNNNYGTSLVARRRALHRHKRRRNHH